MQIIAHKKEVALTHKGLTLSAPDALSEANLVIQRSGLCPVCASSPKHCTGGADQAGAKQQKRAGLRNGAAGCNATGEINSEVDAPKLLYLKRQSVETGG